MRIIETIFREIAGLFVDDGRLAIGIVVCVAAGVVLIRLGLNPAQAAVLLTLGLVGLLVENIWRSARERAGANRDQA